MDGQNGGRRRQLVNLDVIAEDNNRCGESPIWDASRHRLLWTDIEGELVYEFVPATGEKNVLSRSLNVAGIGLCRTGELVFVGTGGLHLWRGQDDYRTLASEQEGVPLAFNDLIVDAKGRVYAGTVYWGENGMERPGKLYLIEKGGAPRVVEEGVLLANGLGFSPDDRTLYFADSAARRIYAYAVNPENGDLSQKRVFADIPDTEGLPDGLTVDRDGYVWSAQWYGAQVVRYDPDGKAERRLPMPVPQVSSVGFGGDALTDLYITTAGETWVSALAPPGYDFHAPNIGGSLYRFRLDIQGRPEHLADLI
jgi:D-xylonolactonase